MRWRRRRGAPCAPGSARLGPLLAPAGARGALSGDSGHPAARARALRRWGERLRSGTCPGRSGGRAAAAASAGAAWGSPGRGPRAKARPGPAATAGRGHRAPHARGRLCPPMARRGSREGGRRPPQVCRGAPAAAAGEEPVRSRRSGRGVPPLRVGPPGRGHADTLARTGWHRHNPPAGVTGALLPAAKTCPRYGACAAAPPAPEEFPGEESAAPRGSGWQLAPGIPSASGEERLGSQAKAEPGEAPQESVAALSVWRWREIWPAYPIDGNNTCTPLGGSS